MKREFLRNLGVEEENIDKILDEISDEKKEIQKDLSTAKEDLANKTKELGDAQKEVKRLQDVETANQDLTTQIETLKGEKTTLETDWQTKFNDLQLTHGIKDAIHTANGRDFKSIEAHLDKTKIKLGEKGLEGIEDQLKALKESHAYLFEAQAPKGTTPADPNSKPAPQETTFEQAVAKALGM